MAFYDDMQALARDLLLPDSQGGLGQGVIQIARETPGVPDPAQPWLPVGPTTISATVNQIGNPKAEYRVGETVIKTDLAFMIEPPSFEPKVGDVVQIRGVDAGRIVHVERLGSLDVPVYFKIWANR